MGQVTEYPPGAFCWIDLGTTDPLAARDFYAGMFGWELIDVPAGDGTTYTLCRLNGRDVCGMHAHAEEEGSAWTSYVSVADADAVTARAAQLGATVVAGPRDVAGTARMSVLRDPAGATVCLWQSRGYPGAQVVNEVGSWTWNELSTPDLEAAKAFYGELFGWSVADLPGAIPRASFSMGDLLIGAVHPPAEQEGTASRWTVAFRVADAHGSAARVQELGGRVLLAPLDTQGRTFSVVADPAGAVFTMAATPEGAFRGVDRS